MKLAAAVLTGNSVLNSVLTAVNRQIENWLLLLKWVITVWLRSLNWLTLARLQP